MNLGILALALVGSGALSAMAVAMSIRIAHRVKAFDAPDGARKIQERPVPRLGGVAVALVYSTLALLALVFPPLSGNAVLAFGLLLPALGMALLGWVDDQRHVRPSWRLSLQALAAGVAWAFGTRISVSGIAWLDFMIFVFWVLIIVNGINLLDNSDGLAGSTALVAAAGAAIVAFMSGQELVALLGVILAGVALGFLWHNWAPAKVYLGDSGAYFLGFMLALLAVRLRPEDLSTPIAIIVPVLLLALPIADTGFVVIRRLVAGRHPFTAGRDHLSHEVQKRGFGVPGSVVTLQAVSILGAFAAVFVTATA